MTETQPEIMTIGETAQYLRISRSSLYKIAQDGRIPCQKVGRHWRFRRAAIDRWLEELPSINPKNIKDQKE
jgi:excisionase family DNA binding protein